MLMPARTDPVTSFMSYNVTNKSHSEFFTHNLQFNYLVVHFNSPDFEVNPYCTDVAFSIGVILLEFARRNIEKLLKKNSNKLSIQMQKNVF